MRRPVGLFVKLRVLQPEVGAQVENPLPRRPQLGTDLRRNPVRQREEHHLGLLGHLRRGEILEPDRPGRAAHRQGLLQALSLQLPGSHRGHMHARMPDADAHEFLAGVTGCANHRDGNRGFHGNGTLRPFQGEFSTPNRPKNAGR